MFLFGVASFGCDASFESFREAIRHDVDASAAVSDAGRLPEDAGSPGEPPDAGNAAEDVLGVGSFEGRAGHTASGTAVFKRTASGLVLELADDFRTQSVPGPVVVVSQRESLGGGLDPAQGDIELAVLSTRSGAQSYPVPEEGAASRYAWIYCRPFRVEVGRAPLEAP
jgi:hypothetical protein